MVEHNRDTGRPEYLSLPEFTLSERERVLAVKYGFVPQFRTQKEWEVRRVDTLRIIEEAAVGLAGYKDMVHFQNEEDVIRALGDGKLVPLPELDLIRPDIEFEELVEPSFRSCVPGLALLLWRLNVRLQTRLGALPKDQYLAIISATRTLEIQNLLIKLGYHAAPVSTHTLGVAVDISSKFLDQEATREAWQILEESRDRGEIIFVREIEEPHKAAHINLPFPGLKT